ncbi:MAG: hypothetical protein U5K54_19345 [Cytophagales bacterium]|nr:hypothetical protein [Cytophagales bacterium]
MSGNSITVCSSSVLTLDAPSGFSEYLWSDGSVTQQLTVSNSGSYSVTVTNAAGCSRPTSEILTVTVVPAPCVNQPPVINSTSVTTSIGGLATINLIDLDFRY